MSLKIEVTSAPNGPRRYAPATKAIAMNKRPNSRRIRPVRNPAKVRPAMKPTRTMSIDPSYSSREQAGAAYDSPDRERRPSMTETITRGAANQAGAHINKDAYKEAKDFLPLNGLDYVEFWVG